ncbi:MAG: Mrp/NBP35 family ATP-binding protein [Desulfotomaculaceae bacterium]|nr:Mrp/NBP35 family ATP-binding protein [Desulfotomaculaceae bacterium]
MQQDSNGTLDNEKNGGCGFENKANVIEKLNANDFSRIENVIAVMSGKGGVGKSSVTSLLACEFKKKGYAVGVLDADITGPSLPKMFGVKGRAEHNGIALLPLRSTNGIKVMSLNLVTPNEDDPVIWRGPLIAGTVKQFWTDVAWGDLDYLFVDLPPGTGDVPLTVMQSLPLNGVVIVSSPQDLAVMIVSKAIRMAQMMDTPIIGLVENMSGVVCPHCGEKFELFGPGQGQDISDKFHIPFIGSLPLDPHLSKLCDQGKVEEYDSNLFINYIPERLAK